MEKYLLAKKQQWLNNFMAQGDHNDAISYEALALGLLGKDNKALERAIAIEKTIPERKDKKTGIERMKDMYKNYVVESKVLETLRQLYPESDIDFYSYGSYYFHSGRGYREPDYIDKYGKTLELKRFDCSYYADWWHGADLKLVYLSGTLYLVTKTGKVELAKIFLHE